MKRLAIGLVLAVSAVVAPPARAETGVVTITGSTSGYVDVDLARGFYASEWTIGTKGRYAGFYVTRLDPDTGQPDRMSGTAGGALLLKDLTTPAGKPTEVFLGLLGDYQPGRFRVWLIADGPTTVNVHTSSGEPARRLRPAKRVRSGAKVAPLPATQATSKRQPVVTTQPFLAVTALMLTGRAPLTSDVDVCVTAPQRSCPDHPFLLPYLGSGAPADSTRLWQAVEQHPAGGRYEAVQAALSPLPVDRALGASFTLQLS